MKLPPSSALTSIAVANLPRLSASAVNGIPLHDMASSSNTNTTKTARAETEYHADTGVLSQPLFAPPRHLQNPNNAAASNCPSTCSPALCTCVAAYGYAEPCALELHAVCNGVNSYTLDQCLASPEYIEYYQNVYCPFAACRVGGGSYEKCQCDSYEDFCDVYKDKEGYASLPKTVKYCGIASCCSDKMDDGGRRGCLLDTFKEMVLNDGEEGETATDGEEQAPTTEESGDGTTATVTDGATEDATNEPIDLTGGDTEVEEAAPPPPSSNGRWMTPSFLSLTFVLVWFATVRV